MSLTSFSKQNSIQAVMRAEGWDKYTNDPTDAGGETRFGIIKKTALRYQSLWAKHSFNGDMKTLPQSLAEEIYDKEYWSINNLDQVSQYSPILAYLMFNIGVNSSPGTAAKQTQRALNVFNVGGSLYPDIAVDGAFGPGSIKALAGLIGSRKVQGMRAIVMTLAAEQMVNYVEIAEHTPSQEKYSLGWANRIIEAITLAKDDLF